jgi:uncharacterized protein YdeI (YjbR/CyaY-like superfamily)
VVAELEADEEPRTVAPPADLAAAIARRPRGAGRLRRPLLTHRREYVEWVTGAKRPETRRRRVQQAVVMLRDGRPHP